MDKIIKSGRYSVRELQKLLKLSCPQPIYRWMKGTILPSVDNLYMLSRVYGLHMEDMLVIRSSDKDVDSQLIDATIKLIELIVKSIEL